MNKNSNQRIECGKRFVTDIEIKVLAEILKVSVDNLISDK